MKTVADLKRAVVVGTVLLLDNYTVSGQARTHKYLNIPRVVGRANTVGFAQRPIDLPVAELSHCDWPKSAEFAPDADGNGFGINHGHIHLHYRIRLPIQPVFRVFKEGGVIALWGEPDRRGFVESYMHVGQHGDGAPHLIKELREATPEEAAPLASELRSLGYHF